MSERDTYNDGEFCWVDLASPDVDASARFYGEMIGWEFQPVPGPPEETGGYGNLAYNGKLVAGLGGIMGEGQPPAWMSYVKTSDADATAERVKEAGSTVLMEPFDLPGGAGRMAVCQDTEGAVFSLLQPGRHQGAGLVNEVGSWTWNNLLTRDPDAAAEFYGKVFGWSRNQPDGAPDYIWNWQMEGQRWPEGLAGLMAMGTDMPSDAPPHWQVYLAVEDLEKALELTKSARGRPIFGPIDIPVGRLAVAFDPQGAAFALIEPDYPDPR
jgi:predicted enzyme related to lactoylglutathione lyase